jgi:tetratricopeptide (TPR) repeat protein
MIMNNSLSYTKKILIVLFSFVADNSYAITTIPKPEITILVTGLGKEGDPFPIELSKLWDVISITQNENTTIEIAPSIKLIRIDLSEEKILTLPSSDTWVDKLVKPDPRIALKKQHDFLEKSKINKEFSDELASEKDQKNTRISKYSSEIINILEVVSISSPERNQFSTVPELLINFKKKLSEDISKGTELKYLILYHLDMDMPFRNINNTKLQKTSLNINPLKKGNASLETEQHIKQGMIYVSMAKQNKATQTENIKNALTEFDAAVKLEEASGKCYAPALMNRGLAYSIDKKLNLAEKDLIKATECNNEDPITFYNLMSYYAAINKADLALEPLNKALDLGFKDCDVLRKDPDLKNLRKMNDFKRSLELHSLFCLK